jgi:uncharacterized membrane protein
LIGFALGGFFDGIVLHQILQWHHLLSGLEAPGGSDLRFQVMADGLFHLFMYLLAVLGAVILVGARASGEFPGTMSEILRLALIGFGFWHVVDAVVSHWLLGLHRIKMDSDAPLAWDIVWLALFGVLPLVFGAVIPTRGGPSRGTAATMIIVTFVAGLATAAAPALDDRSETIIVFRAGMTPSDMMTAVINGGARLKWTDPGGSIWAVDEVSWYGSAKLYFRGALIVSSTPLMAGCLAWTRRPDISNPESRRRDV